MRQKGTVPSAYSGFTTPILIHCLKTESSWLQTHKEKLPVYHG
jgi:hypothetical protein